MKFTSIAAASLVAASASAQDVACRINGQQGSVVDLDTGVCSFQIPSSLPVVFDFTAIDNYTVDAYYVSNGNKFWNDIANAGRIIDVPAKDLYNNGNFGFFHVHDSETPAANSSSSLKKRFHSQIKNKRDEISDLVAYIKTLNGDGVAGFTVEVSEPDVSSSSASAGSGHTSSVGSGHTSGVGSGHTSGLGSGPDATVTHATTTVITITSCSANKCSETAVGATRGPVTATVNGEVTVYTTWCPISGADTTVTEKDTTLITITSCSHNECSKTHVAATRGPVTTNVGGELSVYTTWLPVSSQATSTVIENETTTITVTSCSDHKCVETEVPAVPGTTSVVSGGETIIFTTFYPVASTTTAPGAGTPETNGPGVGVTRSTRRPGVGVGGPHGTTSPGAVSSESTTSPGAGAPESNAPGVGVTRSTRRPGVGGGAPESSTTPGAGVPEGTTSPGVGAPGVGGSVPESSTSPGVGAPGVSGGVPESSSTPGVGGPGVGGPGVGGPGVGGPGVGSGVPESSTTPGVGGPGVGGPGVGGPGVGGGASESSTSPDVGATTSPHHPGLGGGRKTTTSSAEGVPTAPVPESSVGESTASVSSFINGAGKIGASFVALVALPLAYVL